MLFIANSNYNAETWAWDFNMDGLIDSDSSHAEWIYNASGRYNVCLTINDGMTDYTDLRYNFIHVYEYGCTNRYSCTFDPNATIDDGSCLTVATFSEIIHRLVHFTWFKIFLNILRG